MVTIKKGSRVYTVTKGVYENSFRKQGYKIVDEEIEPKTPLDLKGESDVGAEDEDEDLDTKNSPEDEDFDETEDESDEESDEDESEDEPEDEDLSEKPLSKMNTDELKAYAKQLGVDVSECTTKKEMKEAIKEAL